MSAPAGYRRLTDGTRCRCINLWREADGSHWCCAGTAGKAATEIVADGTKRLNEMIDLAESQITADESEAAT